MASSWTILKKTKEKSSSKIKTDGKPSKEETTRLVVRFSKIQVIGKIVWTRHMKKVLNY